MTATPALPGRQEGGALVTSRLLPATPAQVLAAFTAGARLARWWGPAGFRNTFQQFEPRPGGRWHLVMHGPDGRDYQNENLFEAVGPDRVVVRHLSAPHFVLTVTLAPREGSTLVGWHQDFESAELAAQLAPVVRPANEQNLDRLLAELARDGGQELQPAVHVR